MPDTDAGGEAAMDAARAIQKDALKAEQRRPARKAGGAMQAGARPYPEPPLPAQHQAKPGVEADLTPQPFYDAPY